MTLQNLEVAEQFNKLANLLEIEGANPFRVRAYRTAARIINGLAKNIVELVNQGEDLTNLPGIGTDLADKIKIIATTGELPLLKEIEARLPPLLNDLMEIEGLGPKRIQIIYKELNITTIDELKLAINSGHIREIKGFGEKIEQKILQGLEHANEYSERAPLLNVMPVVQALINYLKAMPNIGKIVCGGSFRRRKETIGDLDFVVTAKNGKDVIDYFVKFAAIREVISHGTTRSSVRLQSGIQVDLRVVEDKSYGAAMIYFTGSKDHNIAIRKMALRKKLKINEYGIYKGKKMLPSSTEQDVYKQIGLPYIEPELREDRGEIEAAQNTCLPELIELKNMRGDLRFIIHDLLDEQGLKELIRQAQSRYYTYIGLAMKFSAKKNYQKQCEIIDALNIQLKDFMIFKTVEVDILQDGSLSLPSDLLQNFDFVIASIHHDFDLSDKEQTERIIRAMQNNPGLLLSRPTGRVINSASLYKIDIEKVIVAAKTNHCILELNAQPAFLDLNDINCKLAKTLGVKIAINTASHSYKDLDLMELGIFQARRGWLEANDVINAMSAQKLVAEFKTMRKG